MVEAYQEGGATNQGHRDPAKIERYLHLIEECRGNISEMARQEAKRRTDVKDYIDRTPELLTALNDWRQGIIDKSEDNIFKAAESGDLGASKMIVATLGKDRGWVPREEQTGKDGKDLVPPMITFVAYEPEAKPEAEASANDDGDGRG